MLWNSSVSAIMCWLLAFVSFLSYSARGDLVGAAEYFLIFAAIGTGSVIYLVIATSGERGDSERVSEIDP
jgi:hypothetical protein